MHRRGRGSSPSPFADGRGDPRGRFTARGSYRGESGPSTRGSSRGSPFGGDGGRGGSRGRGGRAYGDGSEIHGRGRGGSSSTFGEGRGGFSEPFPRDLREVGNWRGRARDDSSHFRGGRAPKPKFKDQHQEYDIKGDPRATDTGKALAEVEEYAKELAKQDDNKLSLREVKAKHGLRTSFREPDPNTSIATNYLRIQPPNYIYVYRLEMIRAYTANNRPILVKKFADKMRVADAVARDPAAVVMQQVPKRWATDGDLIWSVNPLWPTNNTSAPVFRLQDVNYTNECGMPLSVEDVMVSYYMTIDSRMSPRELFQDAYTTNFKSSRAAILMRGLNAFFTAHARTQAGYTLTSGNHAYDEATQQLLVDDGVRAVKGFFLSSRPSIDTILLNINTATSPFYPYVTVDDMLRSSCHSTDTLSRILRGVKVRIMYDIRNGWNQPEDRVRFIHRVGSNVQSEQCEPQVTVFNWFMHPNPQHNNQHLYPTNLNQFSITTHTLAIETATDSRQQPTHTEWYPATMLRIIQFQPFHGDLQPEETSAMINLARLEPDQNASRILNEGLTMFGFQTINQGRLVCGSATDFSPRKRNLLIVLPGRFQYVCGESLPYDTWSMAVTTHCSLH